MGDTETQTHAQEEGVAAHPRRPRKEAVRLGKEIYKRDILPQVEANHFGEYVAIDVETGDWTVADHPRRGGASASAASRRGRRLV